MAHNFPYLNDTKFLKQFDRIKLKEQYAKLVVLTFDEKPIQQIQGRIIGGSFNIDGSSSMRRTGNLSMVADDYENDLTDTKHLLSINKKIEVFIGFANTTDEYTDFPILWFPQGIYVIMAPNISHNSNGINISLTLHDKMALLNGQCGGVLPASVVFHEMEDIDENGDTIITQPTIFQIIQQLVNHFGGEQLGKIIISDVDSRIKKVMKWTGSTPLYIYQEQSSETKGLYSSISTDYNQFSGRDITKIHEYNYGQDVGYILTDFVYPGELIGNAGDTVVTILDQIKNVLGNYEYFYDINGNFRFQEIKNYLNTSFATTTIDKLNAGDYIADYIDGKSVYTFEDGEIIQSYSNSPQYQQIKNDFLVWGKRLSINGNEIPIRYHLAIDSKPIVGNQYNVFFYTDPNDKITKAKKPIEFDKFDDFPQTGQIEQFYYAADEDLIYKWVPDEITYVPTLYKMETITTNDFRTELYLNGVTSEPMGLYSNYYYTELKNEWPKLYDIHKGKFFDEVTHQPSDIDFFLDFIDTPAAISEFSIQNIGRRTVTIVEDSVNCIFEPENLNLVIIETNGKNTEQIRKQCIAQKQNYVQVRPEIYSLLMNGGVLKSAYEEIRKELYQYTNYNEQISLTVLPIYYLEPNTRITVRDPQSGIYGDYIIKTISLPLDINGMMNLSCTKAIERI